MALDEALLERHIEGAGGAVVRIYGWSAPAVTIGYTQDAREAVDRKECEARGIPVIRRITGGGAVFHNSEVTYSIVGPAAAFGGVIDSFMEISTALIAGLKRLGLQAEFAPENDLLVSGMKISGNAQVRRKGALLQHGTILLDVDRDAMFAMLTVSEEKLKRKRLARAADRVTSATEKTGRPIDFDEAASALRRGFEDWMGEPSERFDQSDELISLAQKLAEQKFSSPAWNDCGEWRGSEILKNAVNGNMIS